MYDSFLLIGTCSREGSPYTERRVSKDERRVRHASKQALETPIERHNLYLFLARESPFHL